MPLKGGWGPNRLKFLEVTGGSGKSLKFLEAVLREERLP